MLTCSAGAGVSSSNESDSLVSNTCGGAGGVSKSPRPPTTANSRTRETRSQTATASPSVFQLLLDFGDTLELCLGHALGWDVNDLELVLGSREGLAPS